MATERRLIMNGKSRNTVKAAVAGKTSRSQKASAPPATSNATAPTKKSINAADATKDRTASKPPSSRGSVQGAEKSKRGTVSAGKTVPASRSACDAETMKAATAAKPKATALQKPQPSQSAARGTDKAMAAKPEKAAVTQSAVGKERASAGKERTAAAAKPTAGARELVAMARSLEKVAQATNGPPVAAALAPRVEITAPVVDQNRPPRVRQPGDYRLEDQVGFQLRRAHQRATTIFNDVMAEFDVTPTQFAALAKIDDEGSISQNHLGRLTAMDPSTILGVVGRLVRQGLVQLRSTPGDARLTMIELSPEGQKRIADMKDRAVKVSRQTLQPLSENEAKMLTDLLSRIG